MDSDTKKPNRSLRYYRENQGWSQQKLAELVDTSEDMISRWERGVTKTSPYYREKLCTLFGKTAKELGFLEQERTTVSIDSLVDDTITELLQPLVEHPQCAWVIAWGLGEEVSNIELVYDSSIQYESTMPDNLRQVLDDWCVFRTSFQLCFTYGCRKPGWISSFATTSQRHGALPISMGGRDWRVHAW